MTRHWVLISLAFSMALSAIPDGVLAAEAGDGQSGNGQTDFFKDWAVGLAVIRPKKSAVSEASIVNGVVRVGKESRSEASLLVARHFFPFRTGKKCETADVLTKTFYTTCTGAMIGVGLGTSSTAGASQLINFVGLGLTVGGGVKDDQSLAWNFGLGVGRKFNQQVLGDGLTANDASPAGETQVRYKTVDVQAPFFYFTVHW